MIRSLHIDSMLMCRDITKPHKSAHTRRPMKPWMTPTHIHEALDYVLTCPQCSWWCHLTYSKPYRSERTSHKAHDSVSKGHWAQILKVLFERAYIQKAQCLEGSGKKSFGATICIGREIRVSRMQCFFSSHLSHWKFFFFFFGCFFIYNYLPLIYNNFRCMLYFNFECF